MLQIKQLKLLLLKYWYDKIYTIKLLKTSLDLRKFIL